MRVNKMKNRFALKIAYLGWNYQGFQRQKESIETIEGTLITTLENLGIITEKIPKRYTAAGRTDRGVHALSQVIAFDTPKKEIYLEEINQHLPSDIFAWGIAKVKETFHARRDAIKRTYKMFYPYSNENIDIIKQALDQFKGTHDFIKLSKRSDILPSGQKKSTILTIDQAEVDFKENLNILEFTFTSKSFLWHQVRKMVSLILDIGTNKYAIDMVSEVLNPKSNLPKGGIKPVAPDGLILYNVEYQKISFKKIERKALIESKIIKELIKHTSRKSILQLMKESILNNDKQ
ncbi:MAG: tRNA pseudouridine(38-40) synthase TruA [Asgard group archaeon]|nr:tRNA pseudouridine(38-40) synthase TruA [Asgard group archaeon]